MSADILTTALAGLCILNLDSFDLYVAPYFAEKV